MSTIPSLFFHFVSLDAQAPFLHQLENGVWISYSKKEALEAVAGVAQRLVSMGVHRGSVVAICAHTRKEWAVLDLAIQSVGAISVGIYPTLTPEEIAFQLSDSGAMMLAVEDGAMYKTLEPVLEEVWDLVHIVSLTPCEDLSPLLPAQADLEFFQNQVSLVQPSDISCLVYTSGTTGISKGVPLTHRQIVYNLQSMADFSPIGHQQRAFICLPLAHSLQRFALYRGLIEDVQGYFCSLEELPSQLQIVRPTILIAVPRMLEKIQQQIYDAAQNKGAVAGFFMHWATILANTSQKSRRVDFQKKLMERAVYRKIRSALGGHIQTIFCGGAPLRIDTARFFSAVHIRVQEGWGLTETCAPATVNPPHAIRLGSVGLPFGDTIIKIAKDGEILVKGSGVVSHYWGEEVSSCFSQDGFFLTGDVGHLDDDGYLWITGRKKDLIITAAGKNIAPQPIIQALLDTVIEDVVLLGDAQPYLCALVICVETALSIDEKKVHVSKKIAHVNQKLPRFAQIKKFRIIEQKELLGKGFLTPTLKIKRKKMIQTHIDMYDVQ